MSAPFYIRQGDRKPFLQATLVDGNGNPINLTGSTVTFSMTASSGTPKVTTQSCAVVNFPGGVVQYQWGATDTDTVDTFRGVFEVTDGSGFTESFPSYGSIPVVVSADLS